MKMDESTEPDDAQTGEARWVYAFALCRTNPSVYFQTHAQPRHTTVSPSVPPFVRAPTPQSLARSIATAMRFSNLRKTCVWQVLVGKRKAMEM